MKATKEKADNLQRIYGHYADFYRVDRADIQCAILSVKDTIEVLRDLKSQMDYTEHIKPLINKIKQQTELLKELESRL